MARIKSLVRFMKRHLESIIALLVFLVVISLFLFKLVDSKVFLGLIGATATLYFGMLGHRVENDRVFKELFESFNGKYDQRFNDLINTLHNDEKKQLTQEDRNIVIDYFNLCSEEFLWYSRNRIPSKVWRAWKNGILNNLEDSRIKQVYLNEIGKDKGRNSYYGLADELNL